MADVDFADPRGLLAEAFRLRENRDYPNALRIFSGLISGQYGEASPDQVQTAYRYAFKVLLSLNDPPRLEGLCREAIGRFPQLWQAYHNLAIALVRQGRDQEAREPLNQAMLLAPDETDPRNLLRMLRDETDSERSRPVRVWPRRVRSFEDPRDAIERFLLRGAPEARFIAPETRFAALGSCFAQNFAHRLEATGRPVSYEAIGEEVNSTFANRSLLQWLEHGATDAVTAEMERVYGADMRDRLRGAISEADVLILTLGVAPCFFDRKSGDFVFVSGMLSPTTRELLLGRCDMRTTTVAENTQNIEVMLESVRRLSGGRARVVLTVSPVPLQATNEFHSAVIADCLSKATLRLACQEALSHGDPDHLTYWPSFEIVRWLGVNFSPAHPPVYGADDRNTLHVSQWLVDIIIDLFLEHHGIGDARVSSP